MSSPPDRYLFEALGDQDRSSFFCGIPELDEYFHRRINQDAKRKVAAPFVMLDPMGRVAGYYTLSAYSVGIDELPLDIARKLPKYPLIPATLLGRLAVCREYHGKKLGKLLLMDALYRSWNNTAQVASAGVVAEAIDEGARTFYLHHEFIALIGQPRKVFIPMKTIARLFA